MKNRTFNILLALALVLSFNLVMALPAAAEAGEVWVAPAPIGDNDNAGTESAPFATIQKGIDTVSSPGKVHVSAGTYNERITLKDGVEVLGAGAAVTIIDGAKGGTVVAASFVGPGTKLDGVTITGGKYAYGGGMYNDFSSLTVTNCTFSGNSATSYGGGIYNYYSTPALINCTFSGNSAISGGGIYNWGSSPTVTNTIFSGNSASSTGGGIDNETYSSPLVINSIFDGNSAGYGGGIYNLWSAITLTNCIFSNNSGTVYGGGIYNDSGTPPIVVNSILWGDTASKGNEVYSASLLNVTYSNIEGGYTGTGNINADPLFLEADLHPDSGSPCIDSGNNGAVPADAFDLDGDGDTTEPLPVDLDGNPRIFGSAVDMGAYEAQMDEPLVANAGGPYLVDEGEALILDASGSYDPAGGVCSYDWDLDEDGEYDDATGVTPTVSFDSDGAYTVGLKVTNSLGEQDTDTASVSVNDLGPTAVLTGDNLLDQGQAGSFDASGSTSSPDTIISYEWDWDYDGVTFNSSGDSGSTQSHAWSENGSDTAGASATEATSTYTIAMRVTDDDGSMDIATLSVTIENPPPETTPETLKDYLDTMELPENIENSLNSSLDTAIKALEDSNPKNDVSAVNALEAFINKIEAQRGKKISDEEADDLIAQARAIIETISGAT